LRVESFELRLPRTSLATIEEALLHEGRAPLRWAIVAVEGETLVVAGARLCST
jgi:hypothetical protein